MIVRFATVCDVVIQHESGLRLRCDRRSPEYTAHTSCRVCGSDVCPEHAHPGTLHEDRRFDGERSVVCVECDPADE